MLSRGEAFELRQLVPTTRTACKASPKGQRASPAKRTIPSESPGGKPSALTSLKILKEASPQTPGKARPRQPSCRLLSFPDGAELTRIAAVSATFCRRATLQHLSVMEPSKLPGDAWTRSWVMTLPALPAGRCHLAVWHLAG